jgi:hypothetical protein
VTVIPFDKDFKKRNELDRFISEFAQKPATWRREFISRFEALPLDDGGKEFLGVLQTLHSEITNIHKGQK